MSQTIKNLFISSDILWTLKIQEPYQPLDVDDAGDWFTEVKYGKCTLHSRMCASIIRNYLNRNIAGLCHFDQVQKLVEGSVTLIRMSGSIDAKFRSKRLLEGG